jgi:SH3 domain
MSPSSRPGNRSSTVSSALSSLAADASVKKQSFRRSSSCGRDRLSTYSTTSQLLQNLSRPVSHVFPIFHSSLSYALVRDFAYPIIHPLHYGPPASSSSVSTPVTESRRLSDPSLTMGWTAGPWSNETVYGREQLPSISFADGPPYSEDEDLHSPIVTASRHRKQKSAPAGGSSYDYRRGRSPGDSGRSLEYHNNNDRGVLVSLNGDGSETYYVKDDDSTDDGPGGELVTYPASEGRYPHITANVYGDVEYTGSHFNISQGEEYDPNRSIDSDDDISDSVSWKDVSRYSRDYQFSIASPDEEMHGKAVALFDFTREHENELPLKEGQVILVSYRHGQGWLVAEDPKTGESGLVPEEFVRLVRDIEGGLTSLNGELNNAATEPSTYLSPLSIASDQVGTPTQDDHFLLPSNNLSAPLSNGANSEKHPSVVSTFSTSSRDLEPYPPHLLGGGQGKNPPQIQHYDKKPENGSPADTSSSET